MIKLSLDVETPLTEDDRDILAGISVMMLAIANRQNLAEQHLEQQDAEEEQGEPMPCGSQSKDDPTLYCVKEVAHLGRHKFRPMSFTRSETGSLN